MIKNFSDQKLLSMTLQVSKKERVVSSELFAHLYEIDQRKLYADLKLPSLHKYLTRILGYSDSEAAVRAKAARALGANKECQKAFVAGEISMSNISLFSTELQDPKTDIVQKPKGKSNEQARHLKEKMDGNPPKKKPIERKQSDGSKRVSVTLSADEVKTFELLKDKLSPKNLNQVLDFAFKAALEKIENQFERLGTRKPRLAKRQRTIPAHLKKEVYTRAHHQCENCHNKRNLEIDHVVSIAKGGQSVSGNLRLLCRGCNQRAGVKQLGVKTMQKWKKSS